MSNRYDQDFNEPWEVHPDADTPINDLDSGKTVSELIGHIGQNKKRQAEAYREYKDLKEIEEVWKNELMRKLQEVGLKSAKGEKYSASISSRTDIVVTHEQSVLDWIKETPNIEADAYIGLKKTEFKTLAKTLLKDTGEVVPGTELTTIESITVKENK